MRLKLLSPEVLGRVVEFARVLSIDAGALAGALLIVAGIDMMHRPSALIVGGVMLLAVSLLAARRAA